MSCISEQTDAAGVLPMADHFTDTTREVSKFNISVNGVPPVSDITLVEMALKVDDNETTPVTKLFSSATGEFTITDAAGGLFEFDEQIIDVDPGTYVFDIKITFADDTIKVWMQGTWTILVKVTP